MNELKEAMLLLVANDGPLPPEWLDHPLTGDWVGHRECHMGGDFLLIYRLDDSGKSSCPWLGVRAQYLNPRILYK
jgi:mRNA interferase YafQ